MLILCKGMIIMVNNQKYFRKKSSLFKILLFIIILVTATIIFLISKVGAEEQDFFCRNGKCFLYLWAEKLICRNMAEKFINDKTPVYFTYARNDKSVRGWEHIADIVPDLLKTFRNEKVKYSVDVEDIRNGEKISDYEKEIGNAEYVIIILSDRYFYRYNCMFELFNILKNKDGKTIK